MRTERVHALVDRLLARDGCYRPLELLKLTQRLAPEDLDRWQRGELAQLDEALAGCPERVVALLNTAEAWARRIGLAADHATAAGATRRRGFANPTRERLFQTRWQRAESSAQGDLFLDNRYAVARGRLNRALVAADATEAELALAEMAAADPGSDVQADAEHLVAALAWLEQPVADPAERLHRLDQDLAPRARRLLGAGDGEGFLTRFWEQLAADLDPSQFDPSRPGLHPAALHARLGNWQAAIEAIRAVPGHLDQPALLEALATTAEAAGDRDSLLEAVCQLCWRHPAAAEQWLNASRDPELARRYERFSDQDPLLPLEWFPAWLVVVAYPLPELPGEGPGPELVSLIRTLRRQPEQLTARGRLAQLAPALFQIWVQRQGN